MPDQLKVSIYPLLGMYSCYLCLSLYLNGFLAISLALVFQVFLSVLFFRAYKAGGGR